MTDSSPRPPWLELEGIQLAFKAVRAIENVGFRVRRHEICAVIGPNGAGKSSVLNVISGVYRPDAGSITFAGERRSFMLPRHAAQRGIARTFQNIAVFKGMSVLENVLTGTHLRVESSWIEQLLGIGRAPGVERRERQRAEQVLEFLALQRYRQAPVGRLAYGIQKRVELGRALVASPELLLLDEPMAGMNADEKREMSRAILDVNRRFGTTIVLIEHDMRVVMDISDHVVVLDYGRVVGDGSPDEVRQNPDVLRAYLGTRRGAARAA
jgi:branched-chain amino acid transport system ATP-binding protein